MKKLCLTMALFMGSAQAMPSLGDFAEFDLEQWQGGRRYLGQLSMEIVSDYVPSRDAFLVKIVDRYEDFREPRVSYDYYRRDELFSDLELATYMQDCERNEMRYVTITVPAGQFRTCYGVDRTDHDLVQDWTGLVTFGIVKQDSQLFEDGSRYVLKLRRHRRGTPSQAFGVSPMAVSRPDFNFKMRNLLNRMLSSR